MTESKKNLTPLATVKYSRKLIFTGYLAVLILIIACFYLKQYGSLGTILISLAFLLPMTFGNVYELHERYFFIPKLMGKGGEEYFYSDRTEISATRSKVTIKSSKYGNKEIQFSNWSQDGASIEDMINTINNLET